MDGLEVKNVLLSEINDIYELEIKKNTKNKSKIYRFERFKMQNMMNILDSLRTNTYKPIKYNIFMINEPKYRIVMSLNISDKIINHYITRKVLIPKLSKRLSNRNVATRTNLGRDYGLNLIKKDLEYMKRYSKFYILKMDISKYFYSINHNKLKSMIKDYLDSDEYEVVSFIINSTNESYVNKEINKLKSKVVCNEVNAIPNYHKDKGLPIGNMTSQFLSIYYLNELDHKIIHDYKIKNYVRYMDDMILMSQSRDYLINIKNKIEVCLLEKYHLKLNAKKTHITSSREGFVFCGYHFKVINKKTVISVSKSTRDKVKKRVKKLLYLYKSNSIEASSLFSSIKTYENGFKYGDSLRIKRIINDNFFDKIIKP